MAIPVPVTKTKISTVQWGIPITNEVNRLTTQSDTNKTDITALKTATTDSGWQTLTLKNGFTSDGWTPGLRIRKIGNVVYCTGGIGLASGGTSNYSIATVPTGYRPAWNTRIIVGGYYGGGGEPQSGRGEVHASDGNINIQMQNNTLQVTLNCFWFTT